MIEITEKTLHYPVWGDEVGFKDDFNNFLTVPSSIKHAYETYYSTDTVSETKEMYKVLLFTDFTEDVFSSGLYRYVKRIEHFLRPRLRLKQGKKMNIAQAKPKTPAWAVSSV